MSLFKALRTLLGPAGSSSPGDRTSFPRCVEQEWCHFRFQVFLNILRLSLPTTVSRIGSRQFSSLHQKEGIPPEILQAEEVRLRSLLGPYSELIEAAHTIGNNGPEREILPDSQHHEGPSEPHRESQPTSTGDAENQRPGDDSNQGTKDATANIQSSEQRIRIESRTEHETERPRLGRAFQRLGTSRKGKNRAV